MEGIRPVPWVEIVPGGDGILSTVGRTAVTDRQRVLRVVVVPHQLYHGAHILHLRGVSAIISFKLDFQSKMRRDLANMRALGVLS